MKQYSTYYFKADSKGNIKEAKGIVPYSIMEEVKSILPASIPKRYKNDFYLVAVYYDSTLDHFMKITKSQYRLGR